MTLTEVTNHVADGQDNLLQQFKDKANILALLKAWLTQLQEAEAAAFDVLEDTLLATAIGVQLDGIGQIVGEERQGRNDADYRLALSVRILLNNSSGTAEDLISIVIGMIGTAETVLVSETFPAALEITVDTALSVSGANVAAFVASGRGAGIESHFRWFETEPEFRFDTAGKGLDDGAMGGSLLS